MDIGHNSPEQRVRNLNAGLSEKYHHQYNIRSNAWPMAGGETPDSFDLIMAQGKCCWESARILIEGRAHNGYQEPH